MKYLLLIMAWPLHCVHRFWNNAPARNVDWFLFADKKQDIQWYIADIGGLLSITCILWAFYIFAKGTKQLRFITGTLLLISITDIIHYWLWYQQNEVVVYLQGLIMIAASLIIFVKTWKKQ